jgi:steroid delta-isomerase
VTTLIDRNEMLSPADIITSCDRYLEAVAAGDADAMLALWGPEPRLEDPIGAEPLHGRAAIHEFYARDRNVTRLRRLGPVTVSGRHAAFQFFIELRQGSEQTTLVITDLLEFDDDGKIVSMVGCPSDLGSLEGKVFL